MNATIMQLTQQKDSSNSALYLSFWAIMIMHSRAIVIIHAMRVRDFRTIQKFQSDSEKQNSSEIPKSETQQFRNSRVSDSEKQSNSENQERTSSVIQKFQTNSDHPLRDRINPIVEINSKQDQFHFK
jgi:hypothetical protein